MRVLAISRWFTFILPATYLVAALARFSFVSLIYLLCFIACASWPSLLSAIWTSCRPGSNTSSRPVAITILVLGTALGVASTIGGITFLIIDSFSDNWTEPIVWSSIGYYRPTHWTQVPRMIVPDALVAVVGLVSLYLVAKIKVKPADPPPVLQTHASFVQPRKTTRARGKYDTWAPSRSKDKISTEELPPHVLASQKSWFRLYETDVAAVASAAWQTFVDHSVWIALAVAGVSWPSIATTPYFVIVVLASVLWSWRIKIPQSLSQGWLILFIYCCVHLLSLYCCQVPVVSQAIGTTPVMHLLGLSTFGSVGDRAERMHARNLFFGIGPQIDAIVSLLIQFTSIVALFCLLSFKLRYATKNPVSRDRPLEQPLLDDQAAPKRQVTSAARQHRRAIVSMPFAQQTDWKRLSRSGDEDGWWSRIVETVNTAAAWTLKAAKGHILTVAGAGVVLFALAFPSIFAYIPMLLVSIGLFVSVDVRNKGAPAILLILLLESSIQFFYNMDIPFHQSEELKQVGFMVWALPVLPLIIQITLAALFALNNRAVLADKENAPAPTPEAEPASEEAPVESPTALSRTFAAAFFLLQTLGHLIVRNASLLTLVVLYLWGVALINLIHAGYLLFFIIFFSFPRLAARAWNALVVYVVLDILVQYCWQFMWWRQFDTGPAPTLIGLRSFTFMQVPGLWPDLLIAFLALIQRSVFQSAAYEASVSKIQSDDVPQMIAAVYAVVSWLGAVFRAWGLLLCYVALGVIGVLGDPHVNALDLVFPVFLMVCLVIHAALFHSRAMVSKIWLVVVLYCGALLSLRYLYQFPSIHLALSDAVGKQASRAALTLPEVGLRAYPNVYLGLLGTTVLLVLLVMQLRVFTEDLLGRSDDTTHDTELPTVVHDLVAFFARFFILHAPKLTQFALALAFVSDVSVLGLVYLLFLLASVAIRGSGRPLSLFLLVYAEFVAVTQMVFQFSGFRPVWDQPFYDWIGLHRYANGLCASFGYGGNGNLPVILCAVGQSIAWRWRSKVASGDLRALSLISGRQDIGAQGGTMLILGAQGGGMVIDALAESIGCVEKLGGRWVCRLLVVDKVPPVDKASGDGGGGGEKAWAFASYQTAKAFINSLFEKRSLDIVLIVMVAASFVRLNIVGAVWLLFVGISLLSPKKTIRVAMIFLAPFLSLLLLVQFIMILGAPPRPTPWPPTTNWPSIPLPWETTERSLLLWLGLDTQSSWFLLADVAVVYIISLQIRADRRNRLRQKEAKGPVEAGEKMTGLAKDVQHFLLRYLQPTVQALVFIAGTQQYDLISFTYTAISLFFISRSRALMFQKEALWKYLRFFNYAVLAFQAGYQGFLAGDPATATATKNPESWQSIVGLRTLRSPAVAYSPQGVIFDVVIFGLCIIMSEVFAHPSYPDMLQSVLAGDEQSFIEAKAVEQRTLEARIEKLAAVENLRKQRRQRLDHLRQTRMRQSRGNMHGLYMAPMEEDIVADEATEEEIVVTPVAQQQPPPDQLAIVKVFKDPLGSLIALLSLLSGDQLLQTESTSSFWLVLRGIRRSFRKRTQELCFIAMVISAIVNANIMAILLPLTVFCYATLRSPSPGSGFWRWSLRYSMLVILIKYVFLFPFICICHRADADSLMLHSGCEPLGSECTQARGYEIAFRPLGAIGLTKFDSVFVVGVFADLMVLLTLLIHRHSLRARGLWERSHQNEEVTNAVEEEFEYVELPSSPQEVEPQAEQAEVEPQAEQAEVEPQQPTDVEPQQPTEPQPHLGIYLAEKIIGQFADKTGVDHYTSLIVLQLVAFFYFLIFYRYLVEVNSVGGNDIQTFIEQNRIPRVFVVLWMIEFILMILDRTLYLFRSLALKLLVQLLCVVYYHILLFFILPISNEQVLNQSPALIGFYIIKCLYFSLSAAQLRDGYPAFINGNSLMNRPSFIAEMIFLAYRSIPFVFELRVMLDWVCTPTVLIFYDWLKLEDLNCDVFVVKCDIEYYKQYPRRKGDKQLWRTKIITGVGLFSAMVLVLWFPLIAFSGSPADTVPDLIKDCQLTFGIDGFSQWYDLDHLDKSLQHHVDKHEFEELRNRHPRSISKSAQPELEVLYHPLFSENHWPISKPSLIQLKSELIDTANIHQVTLTYRLTVQQMQNPSTLPLTLYHQLSVADRYNLWYILNHTAPTSGPAPVDHPFTGKYVTAADGSVWPGLRLRAFLPELVIMSNGKSEVDGTRKGFTDCDLWLQSSSIGSDCSQLFWGFSTDGGQPIRIYMLASVILKPGVLSQLVSSMGIIGLYVGVVLAVGRFLRMYVSGIAHRIMFEDLPDPESILQMIRDLYTAREDEDFVLEEELFRELIELFRSPDMLVNQTKRKRD